MKIETLAKMSAAELVKYGKEQRGYVTFARPPKYWLDTGNPYLNKVLGSEKYGLAYGKQILLAGFPMSGKTTLAAKIEALAQEDGAEAGWMDGEDSFDPPHMRHQGMHIGHSVYEKSKGEKKKLIGYEKIALFWPEYGVFGKKQGLLNEDSETAEALLQRVEDWMKLRRKINPKGKRIMVIDSLNSLSPEEELVASFTDQNVRTRTSNAVLLNLMSKKWQNICLHTNTLMIFIAQIRTNPMARFGNPNYVSGGSGIQYFPAVVAWMNRAKGGSIYRHKERVGVQGYITNRKNKAGGGSEEFKKCAYQCFFRKDDWKFFSAKQLKGKEKT
jgi:recombination protein RecA